MYFVYFEFSGEFLKRLAIQMVDNEILRLENNVKKYL